MNFLALEWARARQPMCDVGSIDARARRCMDSPRELADEVLLLRVFNVEHEILEVFRKACLDAEALLGVTNAHAEPNKTTKPNHRTVSQRSGAWRTTGGGRTYV